MRTRRESSRTSDARAFLDRWAAVGQPLADERAARLSALDDETARGMTRDLFELHHSAQSPTTTSGLVEQQHLFQALHRRRQRVW